MFARTYCERRVRGARDRVQDRPVQHLLQSQQGHAARNASPDRRGGGGQAGAMHGWRHLRCHRRLAARVGDPPAMVCGRAQRREPPDALHPEGVRPRLQDPGRRGGGLLSDGPGLRARARRAASGGTTRRSRSAGRGASPSCPSAIALIPTSPISRILPDEHGAQDGCSSPARGAFLAGPASGASLRADMKFTRCRRPRTRMQRRHGIAATCWTRAPSASSSLTCAHRTCCTSRGSPRRVCSGRARRTSTGLPRASGSSRRSMRPAASAR